MCLAVPAKLVRITGDDALADLHGNQVRVSTRLVPEVKAGDWVLVHAGFAIQHLDESEAQETFAVLREVEAAAAAEATELGADAAAWGGRGVGFASTDGQVPNRGGDGARVEDDR